MTDHPDADDLISLALGHLDGDRAEDLAAHLTVCAQCRRAYDGYADSIALLLPASPRTAPPPGFTAQALDRLDRARHAGTGRTGNRATARGWVRPLRVAAILVVGLVLGAGAVLGWPEGEPAPAPSTTPEPSSTTAWHAALLTADGRPVGAVTHSYSADGPVLVLEVTGGAAGEELTCRLVGADGTARDIAHWQLSDQRPNSWVIDTEQQDPAQVQLLTDDGQVWATARP